MKLGFRQIPRGDDQFTQDITITSLSLSLFPVFNHWEHHKLTSGKTEKKGGLFGSAQRSKERERSEQNCDMGLKMDVLQQYYPLRRVRECMMRYDRALKHTSSVRCLETFRSIFAVTLPLVSSNLWDAQLVPNDPRYAGLEKNLGIGQVKEG
ncbi:hypothetical protein TNCV_3198401 [Trichonephila clavipes]|nr:hypothetical protein TNCV_3198401 [Trichonephila clavipes]